MLGTLITAVVAVAAGILTYKYLEHTELSTDVEVLVRVPPIDVFLYFKDPNNLPDINYRIKAIKVRGVSVSDDGVEHWDYEVTESFRHLGDHTYYAQSFADSKSHSITVHYSALYGVIQAQMIWSCTTGYDRDGLRGTRMREEGHYFVPYAMVNFVNSTAVQTHSDMLQNLKEVLEGDRPASKDYLAKETG